MIEVIVTDEFEAWFGELSDKDADAVRHVVDMLENAGVGLRFPHSSEIKGSRYALRELRAQSGGRPLRQAVLLVGGDKTGDDRFYEREVPRAEKVLAEYLAEQAATSGKSK